MEIGVVLCLLRNGHGSQGPRASVLPTTPHRLGLCFQRHMRHLETFLCLESPICSLREAAHPTAKLPSVVVQRAEPHSQISKQASSLPNTNTDTQMSGFIESFIKNPSLGELSPTKCFIEVFHFPQAPVTRNTAAAPSPPGAQRRVREPRRMMIPSGVPLCEAGRAENAWALMQMLIH